MPDLRAARAGAHVGPGSLGREYARSIAELRLWLPPVSDADRAYLTLLVELSGGRHAVCSSRWPAPPGARRGAPRPVGRARAARADGPRRRSECAAVRVAAKHGYGAEIGSSPQITKVM
jgi:hypothetical protein